MEKNNEELVAKTTDALMAMYKTGVKDGLTAINLALAEAIEITLPEYKPGLELALQMLSASVSDPNFFDDVPEEIDEVISQKIQGL